MTINVYNSPAKCSQCTFRNSKKNLANVNSRSRSLYAIAVPSVVCLSVTFVHPTQPVKIFSNVSSPFGTLAIRWHPRKIVPGEPLRWGGLNARGVAKYNDFGAFGGHILETVQDRR